MKTAEKVFWGALGTSLALGTAIDLALPDDTQKVNTSLPGVIVEINDQTQGPGSYVNGVFYEDPVRPANIVVEQCPDLNPRLSDCVKYTKNVANEQLSQFTTGNTVVIDQIEN